MQIKISKTKLSKIKKHNDHSLLRILAK